MELGNLQLAFMALCCIAFIIYLIWHSESVDRVTFLAREREATKRQEERDQDARDRRRMVYEADHYNEACNAVDTDQYKRRLNAGIANQAASMEPFCGEGKKP